MTNWAPKAPEWWHDTIKHGAEEGLFQEPPIGWTDEKVEGSYLIQAEEGKEMSPHEDGRNEKVGHLAWRTADELCLDHKEETQM